MRIIYLLLTLFVGFGIAKGQFYSTGTEPWSTKWCQIETAHFQVVFPKKYESKGKDLAQYLEAVYQVGGYSLAHNPRKISVIVHANSSVSNGMVAWAPKRMEIYSVNSQDTYAQDWLQQLAIHEFRHVVQIDKTNIGLTKVLSFLFGESAVGAVIGLYLPPWFLEGDAVLAETVLSQSGRGRTPAFQQSLRAQFLEKEVYSYEKATLGSYKDYVPNHYEIGYQLVASARERYGATIWERAVTNSGKAYHLNPFLRGIREVTGLNKRLLYRSITDSLRLSWGAEVSSILPDIQSVNKSDSSLYQNFLYPQAWHSKVIAQLESPSFTPRFVLIDTLGNKRSFLEIGVRTDDAFDLKNDKMVWSEFRPDLRYTHRNYAVLRTFNLMNGDVKTITSKTRYFAPKLHPIDSTLLCVGFEADGSQFIAILDQNSGSLLKKIPVASNDEIISPIWSLRGDTIYSIILDSRGKRIDSYILQSEQWNTLLTPTFTNISNLCDNDSLLLFTSNNSMQENIFALDKRSKSIYQVTHSLFGCRYTSINSQGQLLCSLYGANGYRVGKRAVDVTDLKATELGFQPSLVQSVSKQELGVTAFETRDSLLVVKPYSRANLLNFHSWGPYLYDDGNTYMGLSLSSQNLLSNTLVTVGYNADPAYSSERYYASLKYSGWFPELELKVKYGDRSLVGSSVNYVEQMDYDVIYTKVDENQSVFSLEPIISVPFNLSNGRFYNYITPMVGGVMQQFGQYSEHNQFYIDNGNDRFSLIGDQWVENPVTEYISVKYGLVLSSQKRRSERDVWSRGGVRADIYYQESPFGDFSRGTMFSAKLDLLIPGLFMHDAFKVSAIFEDKKPYYSGNSNRYAYSNIFTPARGYENIQSDKIMSYKFDYQVPILNPDAVLSGAFYLKRLRLNLFADYSCYSRLESSGEACFNATSIGSDFWIDYHLFQWSVPLQFGYRLGYKPKEDVQFYEFLWSVTF